MTGGALQAGASREQEYGHGRARKQQALDDACKLEGAGSAQERERQREHDLVQALEAALEDV